jgi:uncharacterized protein YggE
MKKLPLLSLVVAAALSRGPVWAQADALSTPHITVNGTAVKEVVPDRLHWSLDVKNTGLELPKVAEAHARKVTALLDMLKTSGVLQNDIQTAHMEFSENRVYRRSEYVKEGYQAQTKVSFKLSDLSKYKPLWTAIAELSGVSVNGVSFDHSKRIELNKETRKLALQMAKEKAAAMAEVLGSKVGEPLAIDEDLTVSEGWGRGNLMMNGLNNVVQQGVIVPAQGESEGMLAPGAIPITIRVRVTFRLLNAGN